MRCRKMKSKLNRYLDGELVPEDREAVGRHVETCATCSAALEDLRTAASALSQMPEPPEVPDGFAERVVARATQRRRQEAVVASFWKSLSPAMGFAAAAMLILGLALGIAMSRDVLGARATSAELAEAAPDAVYEFDYLSDAPEGSLADAYISLASADNGGGR